MDFDFAGRVESRLSHSLKLWADNQVGDSIVDFVTDNKYYFYR